MSCAQTPNRFFPYLIHGGKNHDHADEPHGQTTWPNDSKLGGAQLGSMLYRMQKTSARTDTPFDTMSCAQTECDILTPTFDTPPKVWLAW